MNHNPPAPLPVARTPEGERLLNDYVRRLEARLEFFRHFPLNILIWGPGIQVESAASKKRLDIKDELMRLGHKAMFSEDLAAYGSDLPLTLREKTQVETADMVIVLLEDATGAIAEVYRFATQYDLGRKFCIMIPDKYDAGFVGQDINDVLDSQVQYVFRYTEDELKACAVLTESLRQVRIMQNQIAVAGERNE